MLQDLYLQGRTLGASKNISVSLNLHVTEEIRIEGDQLQLTRMFLNLLTNAIKYTPEGGKVSISLAVLGHEAVVEIADTGIGIAREHLTHIFDRFYRVDEARNRQVGGTGLGLAIVKSIIDAHAGRIDVESAPDRGSAFTIYLPWRVRP
jgi:signal transduction histidine kinase